MKTVIDIITGSTPGLIKDAVIIKKVLAPHFKVRIRISRIRNFQLLFSRKIIALSDVLFPKKRILFFVENIPKNWLALSNKKVFIPNQEWIRENVLQNINQCNEVWCKSEYARHLFETREYLAKLIGFSSTDIYLPDVQKNYSAFIHVAGRSHLKGTKYILDLWEKHPEWPNLTLIAHNQNWHKTHCLKNIIHLTDFLSEADVKKEMNAAGMHLCVSEIESFGHYIAEALSCKSLVITTNAPPMNELVNNETGLLVNTSGKDVMGFGEKFFIDIQNLEETIETALQMSLSEKKGIGEAARNSFIEKKIAFEKNLLFTFNEFLKKEND
jgi:glycosyltransferase involved in cell wall biosynthesis